MAIHGVETPNIAVTNATTLGIVSGVVTQTQSVHVIASEAGVTDDLDTITLAAVTSGFGSLLFIIADTGDTITIKHGTGNVLLPGDADIDLDDDHYMQLLSDGTNWYLVGAYA